MALVNQKKLLVIGGGEWQVPLVIKAKSLDLFVINTNLYPDSPGFEFSDINYVSDVLDKEKNLSIARKHNVDGVVTDQSDIAVPTVAYICEKMGLPGIGRDVAKKFTNKALMRSICRENGFPFPAYRVCSSFEELVEFSRQYTFPLVIKPLASQSSRGVSKIDAYADLQRGYKHATKYSADSRTVLVEQFICGTELTVDGIQVEGKHYCFATSRKTHYSHNQTIASRLLFGFEENEIRLKDLYEQHNLLIEKMGLPFGLTHAEYILCGGSYYLIEVAARGGGTKLSSDIVPLMSGVDTSELLIRMALGEKFTELHPNFYSGVAVMEFFDFPDGVVQSISGVEDAAEMHGVLSVGLSIAPGDTISKAEDDRSRHGYVIAYANSGRELEVLLTKINGAITVCYE